MVLPAIERSWLADPLARLLDEQDGVAARSQLRANGVSRHTVRSQARARRWRVMGPRVVVTTTGPLTWRQRCWVGLLHAGSGAALAGVTAARLSGLRSRESNLIHVLIPINASATSLPGLVLHRSRLLGPADVHPMWAPRRTRLPRSIIDAAVWAKDHDEAIAVVAAAVQQRLARPRELRGVLQRPGRLPRRRLLLLAVGDMEGGSQSLAEIDFFRLCRRAGLPRPDRQTVRRDVDGRRRYLDVDWDSYRLTAEVDGDSHRMVLAWWADMDRQNEVALGDRRVLRFPAMAARLAADRVLDQVARGLRLGGWRP